MNMTPEEKTYMAYMGRKPCGCVVAVTWIEPRFPEDAEADAREYRERGMTVEHVPAEVAREALTYCHCDK